VTNKKIIKIRQNKIKKTESKAINLLREKEQQDILKKCSQMTKL